MVAAGDGIGRVHCRSAEAGELLLPGAMLLTMEWDLSAKDEKPSLDRLRPFYLREGPAAVLPQYVSVVFGLLADCVPLKWIALERASGFTHTCA